LHAKVYAPAAGIAEATYQKHAALFVSQTSQYGQGEWNRVVQPRVDELTARAWAQYQTHLEPSVLTIRESIYPQLQRASNNAVQKYHTIVVPSFKRLLPHVHKTYEQGYRWTIEVAYPYTLWAGETGLTFVTRRIWPALRVLYGRNVEPQVSKIRERLSSYRDRKSLESIIEDTPV